MKLDPAWIGPGSAVGALVIRALGATWRIEYHGREHDPAPGSSGRCIFAFWHARLAPLVYTHRGRGIGVLVSRHHDGEWIARIIERLGFRLARGSSTRGGEEGLRDMLSLAERGHLLGVTPDGPRGPAERVKPGLVYLASRTGFPVVPVASAADRAWVFRSWDRFRLPRPFARVVVAFGEPIAIPPDLSKADAESWQRTVEAAIGDLTRAASAAAGERP